MSVRWCVINIGQQIAIKAKNPFCGLYWLLRHSLRTPLLNHAHQWADQKFLHYFLFFVCTFFICPRGFGCTCCDLHLIAPRTCALWRHPDQFPLPECIPARTVPRSWCDLFVTLNASLHKLQAHNRVIKQQRNVVYVSKWSRLVCSTEYSFTERKWTRSRPCIAFHMWKYRLYQIHSEP